MWQSFRHGTTVGSSRDGLQGGVQPVAGNGEKFFLYQINPPEMDSIWVNIHNVGFRILILNLELVVAVRIRSGNRNGRNVDRPTAQHPVNVCHRTVLLTVELGVGVTVEPDNIVVVPQQIQKHLSPGTVQQVVCVQSKGVTATTEIKCVLEKKTPFVSVSFQCFVQPLQFRNTECILTDAHKNIHIIAIRKRVIQRMSCPFQQ